MFPTLPAAALVLVGIGLGAKGKDWLRAAAPRVGRASRPIVKATIRSGHVLSREMRQLAESVREDLEDITAEAVIESDLQRRPKRAAMVAQRLAYAPGVREATANPVTARVLVVFDPSKLVLNQLEQLIGEALRACSTWTTSSRRWCFEGSGGLSVTCSPWAIVRPGSCCQVELKSACHSKRCDRVIW